MNVEVCIRIDGREVACLNDQVETSGVPAVVDGPCKTRANG